MKWQEIDIKREIEKGVGEIEKEERKTPQHVSIVSGL